MFTKTGSRGPFYSELQRLAYPLTREACVAVSLFQAATFAVIPEEPLYVITLVLRMTTLAYQESLRW